MSYQWVGPCTSLYVYAHVQLELSQTDQMIQIQMSGPISFGDFLPILGMPDFVHSSLAAIMMVCHKSTS